MDNQLWVIAFDKATGERVNFTICDKKLVSFYQAKYEIEGYDTKVLTSEQVDDLIDGNK